MGQAVSRKQYRMMMAVMHGKSGSTSRGDSGPPKSVAAKYVSGKNSKEPEGLPESKGKEHDGGRWDHGAKSRDTERTEAKRKERKETNKSKKEKGKARKAKLKKSLENYIKKNNRKGAGAIVVNSEGHILLGRRTDNNMYSTPGGHVDGSESFDEAALRELREEAGIVGKDPKPVFSGEYRGYDSRAFVITKFKGKVKDTDEMIGLKFYTMADIPWKNLADYARDSIEAFLKQKLTKSKDLQSLLAMEELSKNIIRSGGSTPHDVIHELTHGDALRVVGNGTFRMLRQAVENMTDEDFRELHFDNYKICIRKHVNDVYSGRIEDGHKQIHQFTNKSLPAVAAELMSLFEWYLPEDEEELEILDENDLDDTVIEGGINELVDKYRQHNIVNMHQEMETIRGELRHGVAVDLQQVEQRMMKLFDRLENNLMNITDKHNKLNSDAGQSIDEIEQKLLQLQTSLDKLGKQPVSVNAYTPNPDSSNTVHETYYPYLPRPDVTISPNGSVKISFGGEWTNLERENFLCDLKARVINK